jgi:hypothetical protein
MHTQYQTIGAVGPLGVWSFYLLGLVINFALASSTVAAARKKQQVRHRLRRGHVQPFYGSDICQNEWSQHVLPDALCMLERQVLLAAAHA